MQTYTVTAPGFAPLQVQAVPELAEAVAALTMELDDVPEGAVVEEVWS